MAAGCERRAPVPVAAPPTKFVATGPAPAGVSYAPDGVRVVNRLTVNILRGQEGGIEYTSDGANYITGGEAKLPRSALAASGTQRSLSLQDVAVSPDVVVVQVDVGPQSKTSLMSPVASARTEAPSLIDVLGERYLAVGYVYEDDSWVRVRYTPGKPIERRDELPVLSRSLGNQKLWLIYRVSLGRTVRYLVCGDKAVAEWNPPVLLDRPQNR